MGWDRVCLPRAHRDRGVEGVLLLVPAGWRGVRNGTRGARPTGELLRSRLEGKCARASGSATRHETIRHLTSTVHLTHSQALHKSVVACWQDDMV
jgi:hypothetical protein